MQAGTPQSPRPGRARAEGSARNSSPPLPATKGAKAAGKASAAFRRGVTALAQWIEREGAGRPVPRGHSEQITVDDETEPVNVKLRGWVSNTKTRRDKLAQGQLDALRELGVEWA